MNARRSLLLLLPAALCLHPASAALGKDLFTTGAGVNLRREPATTAAVVGLLARGAILRELQEQQEWIQVGSPTIGKSGWVHRSLVSEFRPAATTADHTLLRGGPGRTFPVLARLARGITVSILAEKGEWMQVTIPDSGMTGFIHNSFLSRPPEATGDASAPPRDRWQGTRTMADGSRYVGQFRGGVFDGEGTLVFPDGRRYTGQFKDGLFDGEGRLDMPPGSYDGQWRNGQFHGQGILTQFDGSRLVGRWQDGVWMGEGKYISAQGDVYEGQWLGTAFHGTGTMTLHDGRILKGQWRNGRFLGP